MALATGTHIVIKTKLSGDVSAAVLYDDGGPDVLVKLWVRCTWKFQGFSVHYPRTAIVRELGELAGRMKQEWEAA